MRIKPEDIKVTVTFTEGCRERYTAACLKVLERRERREAAKAPDSITDPDQVSWLAS